MRFVICVVVSVTLAGCAARKVVNHAMPPLPGVVEVRPAGGVEQAPPQDSLRTFIAKVRELAAEARPEPRVPATTVEGSDRQLALMLAAAAAQPAPATFRAAAEEYRRLGILDTAHDYLVKALSMDAKDAATHDALARLWRDAGFPDLGLGDAYRALHYAPSSAVAHNTLGTILQALGFAAEARDQFQHAARLAPDAAYPLNNLCYAWTVEGRGDQAVPFCREAIRTDPRLVAARNNLGLAYAVAGNVGAAREAFAAQGDRARAQYNVGVMELARRRPADAIRAFREAQALRPSPAVAARLRQAESLQRNGGDD